MTIAPCTIPVSFIKNLKDLATTTRRGILLRAAENGLRKVHPCNTVPKAIEKLGLLREEKEIYVAGFGKAAHAMAKAVMSILGDRVEAGLVVVPRGAWEPIERIEVIVSDHPLPSKRSLEAAERLIVFLQEIPRDSMILFLVSGGGSSLVEKPCTGTIKEVSEITRQLLTRGATIHELNVVRSVLSCTKAGGLLSYAQARKIINLVMSDVVGDNPCFVASGATIPGCYHDPREAERILRKYGLEKHVQLIQQAWRKKPRHRRDLEVVTEIIARNQDMLLAARELLEAYGYHARVLTDRMRGEAREVAKLVAGIAERLEPGNAVILGGETTVTVRGKGIGGRNQELCLAMLQTTLGLGEKPSYAALCMGSDGIDGSSPVAGAIIDETSLEKAQEKQLLIESYLSDNNSYGFFSLIRDVIDTGGYTGVNVNDIVIVIH